MSAGQSIAVVYLHRHPEPQGSSARFLAAYRNVPAGAGHDLFAIVKGFDQIRSDPGAAALREVGAETMEVPDTGFDIGSYRLAASNLGHDLICFLNSHSAPLAEGWLDKLASAGAQPSVGAAGATGSWMSSSTSRPWRSGPIPRLPRRVAGRVREGMRYPGFPNPHLRTNAFLMRRADFLALEVGTLRHKVHALQFESGRRSLTRQLTSAGVPPVVVDREGVTWPIDRWNRSRTFWSEEQQGLLVTDNQTKKYSCGSAWVRSALHAAAWSGGLAPSDEEIDAGHPSESHSRARR